MLAIDINDPCHFVNWPPLFPRTVRMLPAERSLQRPQTRSERPVRESNPPTDDRQSSSLPSSFTGHCDASLASRLRQAWFVGGFPESSPPWQESNLDYELRRLVPRVHWDRESGAESPDRTALVGFSDRCNHQTCSLCNSDFVEMIGIEPTLFLLAGQVPSH